MSVKKTIEDKLTQAFQPIHLDVFDESDKHHGHGGWREGGNTHFRVRITSQTFAGKTRVDIHRLINQTLEAELKGGVHALAIEAKAG